MPTLGTVRVQAKKLSRSRHGRAWIADVTIHLDGGGAVQVGNIRCYLDPSGGPLRVGMPMRPAGPGEFVPVVQLPGPWLDVLRTALEAAIARQVMAEAGE